MHQATALAATLCVRSRAGSSPVLKLRCSSLTVLDLVGLY